MTASDPGSDPASDSRSDPASDPAPVSPPSWLFIGDSITDCERLSDPAGLGDGYVAVVAENIGRLAQVRNRGISGNRAVDLADRWDIDCLDLEPDLVSVLIGVNDTWRRYDSADPTSEEAFERTVRTLLERLVASRPTTDLVLIEPFILPVTTDQQSWLADDLAPKQEAIRLLAGEFDATFVPTQDRFAREPEDPSLLAYDGVHPTAAGHHRLAGYWLESVAAG